MILTDLPDLIMTLIMKNWRNDILSDKFGETIIIKKNKVGY